MDKREASKGIRAGSKYRIIIRNGGLSRQDFQDSKRRWKTQDLKSPVIHLFLMIRKIRDNPWLNMPFALKRTKRKGAEFAKEIAEDFSSAHNFQ